MLFCHEDVRPTYFRSLRVAFDLDIFVFMDIFGDILFVPHLWAFLLCKCFEVLVVAIVC